MILIVYLAGSLIARTGGKTSVPQGLDDLVKNFELCMKRRKFSNIYPQYYHKTDKVCSSARIAVEEL